MPRRPRIVLANTPLHVIQRGNNRQSCFLEDEDYHIYLRWLTEYAQISECLIHAYVLMTNHVHLLLTPLKQESVGILMKRLGQRYVQYFNRTYDRSGTLWEGRFRSCIVDQETYLFTCQRYIEMNPVRASIVIYPGDYRWSSYSVNARGEQSDLITPHLLYLQLGQNKKERLSAYKENFNWNSSDKDIEEIRKATNGNFSLGSEPFLKEVSKRLKRRITPGNPGRPVKTES